LTDIIL